MEEAAERQKMKSLKVTGRNNTRILPANWIAGVDYKNSKANDLEDKDFNEWAANTKVNPENKELPDNTNPITNNKLHQL